MALTATPFNGVTYYIPTAYGDSGWNGTTGVDGLLRSLAANTVVLSANNTLSGNNTFSGNINLPNQTPSRYLALDASGNITTSSGSSGSGDVVGPSSSVDSEIALFSSTTGKLIKRATGTGVVKAVSGVASFATVVDADISSSAAISYSKLALTGSILNADLAGSIAYSKLTLTGSILNGDLAGSIAASKLVGSDIATVGTITSGTWSATTIALNKGGTGQTTKAAAFDALSPMTTSGDVIYGGASGTGTRLAKGSDGDVMTLASGVPSWAAAAAGYSGDDEIIMDASGANGSTNTAIPYFPTTVRSAGTAISVTSNSTSGTIFTINTTGYYSVVFSTKVSAINNYFGILKNPSAGDLTAAVVPNISPARLRALGLGTADPRSVSAVFRCAAGDTVAPVINNGITGDTGTYNFVSITRIA